MPPLVWGGGRVFGAAGMSGCLEGGARAIAAGRRRGAAGRCWRDRGLWLFLGCAWAQRRIVSCSRRGLQEHDPTGMSPVAWLGYAA